jgi:IstB-like ATP binding protein
VNRDQSPISTVNANPVSEEMPRRQPSRLTGSVNHGEACHRAAIEGRWATTMRFYAGPTLLAIDEELGYLPLPNEVASALFQVVSQRYFPAAGQITKRHFDASKEKSFGLVRSEARSSVSVLSLAAKATALHSSPGFRQPPAALAAPVSAPGTPRPAVPQPLRSR